MNFILIKFIVKFYKMKIGFSALVILIIISSCKKNNAPKPEPLPLPVTLIDTTGSLDIDVSNVVNGLPLLLSSTSYTNANNDTFNIDVLKYYFTNVQLKTPTGFTYAEIESYYLINQANASSLHLKIKKIPRANYTGINFLIGVDKDRNTSGAQTGALDPINDMFWTWSSGYIMAKIEGTSPQSAAIDKKITFHLGGFTGLYTSVRSIQLNFPNAANVTETHTPTLHLQAEIAEWFKNPNVIDFANDYLITTPNSRSKSIADNYANMFTVTSVIN